MSLRTQLLSTTFIPIVMGFGVGLTIVPCTPRAASKSLYQMAAACNPCAVKNPCNPCAAACNPCAAAACNPCSPCSPCGAAAAVELTDAEAIAAYNCAKGVLKAGYAKSKLTSETGLEIAAQYQDWRQFSTRSYVSDTHGGRFVQNYGNAVAKAYGKYENAGALPAGSVLAKDSFVVRGGRVFAGPLFVMEKMPAGFKAASGNWRYTLVMPDGKVIGTTNGKGTNNVEFCIGCHATLGEETDSLLFLPDEYRASY